MTKKLFASETRVGDLVYVADIHHTLGEWRIGLVVDAYEWHRWGITVWLLEENHRIDFREVDARFLLVSRSDG